VNGKWVIIVTRKDAGWGWANCATYRPRTQPFCEPQLLQNKTPPVNRQHGFVLGIRLMS
jgi:hypothetical protein